MTNIMGDAQEDENVNMLVNMMGQAVSPEIARGVLRRHKGDTQKAAESLLSGDTAGDDVWPPGFGALHETSEHNSGPRTPPPSKPEQDHSVIDLTGTDEDKELSLALQASLEPQGSGTTFGPSDRAPNANWAMVPSNVAAPAGISQDDQSLNQAIQESLNSTYRNYAEEELQIPPLDQIVRKDNRPVAVRSTESVYTFVGLLFQSLYVVPQVRRTLCHWGMMYEHDPSEETPESVVMSLLECFTFMSISLAGVMTADVLISNFAIDKPRDITESPGENTFKAFSKVALMIEQVAFSESANRSHQWPRLFHFRYGPKDAEPNTSPLDDRIDRAVVRVDVRDGEPSHDLISCLSDQLSPVSGLNGSQQVIFEASEVVAFHLVRHESLPTYSGATSIRQRFQYPKSMYLDRYMKQNADLAAQKKQQQISIQEEVQRLNLRKNSLTQANGKDNLKDIHATLYYFENVANKTEPTRKEATEATAMKLRNIVARLENELESIHSRISELQEQSARLFDDPALQKERYDLRAVLIHDGIPGRSHLYSYRYHNSRWWKTVDYSVTEVSEETVLTDATGLHMGAGPYFLIYSRALLEEEENASEPWPEGFKEAAERDNTVLLKDMNGGQDTLTTPLLTPSFPSSHVSPAYSPKEDPMDIST